jgi:surface antigen
MIGLLPGAQAPIQQDIINLITEKKPAIVQQVKPELTVAEKIAANYYGCNTDTQWIWAQDATCHDKVAQVTTQTQTAVKQPQNGSVGLNGYDYPSCTGYVAMRRYVPSGWGNATTWRQNALASGWTVSNVPVAGAIGWTYGHVVYVESVGDGVVVISENNYDYAGSTRTITVPTSKYVYLY